MRRRSRRSRRDQNTPCRLEGVTTGGLAASAGQTSGRGVGSWVLAAMLLDWMPVYRFRRVLASPAPLAALVLCTLSAAAGCSGILTPTNGVQTNSQFSTAVLAPGGTNMTTFTLTASTFVGVDLVTVASNATGNILAPTMTLVLGTPSGTTCSPLTTKSVTPSLVAQIQQTLQAGSYCASVTDTGLGEPGVTTLRINTSTSAPANIANPTAIDVYSSQVGASGSATHQIPIAFNGVTNIAFASASTTAAVGVAFGVWDGQVCRLSETVTTAATGTTIMATNTDPGNYCIRVFDVGQLKVPMLFTIDTTIP